MDIVFICFKKSGKRTALIGDPSGKTSVGNSNTTNKPSHGKILENAHKIECQIKSILKNIKSISKTPEKLMGNFEIINNEGFYNSKQGADNSFEILSNNIKLSDLLELRKYFF